MRKIIPSLALIAVAATLTAGCGDSPQVASLTDDVVELTQEIKRLDEENGTLSRRLDSAERRISGLSSDLAATRNALNAETAAESVEAAQAPDGGSGTTAAMEGVPKDARQMAEFFDTENGRKVLEDAMRTERERRDGDRWNRMADGMIDRFAGRASLTEDQSKRMKELVGKSMTDIRGAWTAMRDLPANATPEEREIAREGAMAQMGEVRDALDSEVKLILNADQYDMYLEDQSRMRGWGGGNRGGNRNRGGGGIR